MEILSQGGFNLTKWITIDEQVKSEKPEIDRSTKVVKIFEAEPQSSSISGLNWNVDTENLIVNRGTEQEFSAKKLRELSYPLSQQCSARLGYVHSSP